MGKSKKPVDNETVPYLGQGVDPELQKKVESYMEPLARQAEVAELPEEPEVLEEVAELPSEPSPGAPSLISAAKPIVAAGAPLLPTDQLPDLDKVETTPTEHPEPELESDTPEVTEVHTESEPEPEVLEIEDAQTNRVVDEIVAYEADELLAARDVQQEAPDIDSQPSSERSTKKPLTNSGRRKASAIALLLILSIAAIVPTSRYFLLNNIGVRASISIKVFDDKTSQPLKNVELSIAGKNSKTDSEGFARVEKIKLGPQKMIVKKLAFADFSRQVTIGWGSNPQEETRLTPTGSQYSFILTDFLSGKPIIKAEVSSGEFTAVSNEKGEAVLIVPATAEKVLGVSVIAKNYRQETIQVGSTSQQQQALQLSPARKHAFVSKQGSKFDLYKVDADGKNEEKILPGTGTEREATLALVSHSKKDVVAYLSTRENVKNQDGYLLNTLVLVDLNTNKVTKIAQSEHIQIMDWIDDRLVYVKIAVGANAASPNRHRLMSYDLASGSEKELASTNYFNDVLVANGAVYYTPALYQVNGTVGLYKINPDGTNKKTILPKEVWNLFRTSYDRISLSVGQDWYELGLTDDGVNKLSSAPPKLKSRVYVSSPENKQNLWIDGRDGKDVLLSYNLDSKKDSILYSRSGIKNPIRWLDEEHAVYRVANEQETADYVISVSGGEPKKIRDVTNIVGIDRWYYYAR